MKKSLIYIIPIACVGALAFLFLSNNSMETAESKLPHVLSMTKSVGVPHKVDFAGEDLVLDRYDLHERYDREINGFTYLHSTTLLLIKKANRYFPIIEPILKENDIPDDFKYLAVIESSLNHRAVSPAGAVGLWQFMPKTAPSYGLEVSSEVDERYSIEKSTVAACKYFKQAYAKYGSWSSVALSYNAGQGRISGELEKQQAEDGLDLWLVDETTRYYFRMLAIKQVFENPQKYGFVLTEKDLYKPMEFKKVEVTQSIADLTAFAKDNGISYAQLKDFNTWLRDRKLTISAKSQNSYTILIPTQESLYYKKGEKIKVHNRAWLSRD
ncbi:membrane-bound lytic murein transglycosylase D [Dysgonomonas sp. PFB1-18]|uniref:lytic transglycosylase domain-containing protein n=1 Tax=unclassified Dysgonomonas TaxID=2630389 RepID=UPI0024753C0D|nr:MULTISPECIES: lytic transglycosylase domain-containing protein [unclassified Dysgonomonas]MDH6309769.1 membrane-bound lytic murein transglycosylase D [Dysgonomonas sp. PF1-14]MDH6339223.1 membrane-bound lytic murein transglycosylase D [Dysgonomonas sp. PF1-16]MDH6380722.1 membrane-bound lytic murein transglycosylase D [Dysgonomonas sp. PFB1-18]MDH6398218.1 membrane-bound lytic murein transglycosylase D [Dysgonomonas sp. PF1-23]